MTALLEDSRLDRTALVADKIVACVGSGANPLIAPTLRNRSDVYRDELSDRYSTSRSVHKCFSLKDKIRFRHLNVSYVNLDPDGLLHQPTYAVT